MCQKVPHATKQAARQVAKGMAKKYNQSMGVYFCDPCEAWHVETEGKRKRKRDNMKYPFRFDGRVKKQSSKPKKRYG